MRWHSQRICSALDVNEIIIEANSDIFRLKVIVKLVKFLKLWRYRFYNRWRNIEVSIGPFMIPLNSFALSQYDSQVAHILRFIALRSVWLFWHLLILHHFIDTLKSWQWTKVRKEKKLSQQRNGCQNTFLWRKAYGLLNWMWIGQ